MRVRRCRRQSHPTAHYITPRPSPQCTCNTPHDPLWTGTCLHLLRQCGVTCVRSGRQCEKSQTTRIFCARPTRLYSHQHTSPHDSTMPPWRRGREVVPMMLTPWDSELSESLGISPDVMGVDSSHMHTHGSPPPARNGSPRTQSHPTSFSSGRRGQRGLRNRGWSEVPSEDDEDVSPASVTSSSSQVRSPFMASSSREGAT